MRIVSFIALLGCLVWGGAAGSASEESEPLIHVRLIASRDEVTSAELVFLEMEIENELGGGVYLYVGQEKDFAGLGRIRIEYPDGSEKVLPFPEAEPMDDPALAWMALENHDSFIVSLPPLNTDGDLFDQVGSYTLTAEVDLHIRDEPPSGVPEGEAQTFVSTPFPLFRPKMAAEDPPFVLFDLLQGQSGTSVRNMRLHRNNDPPKEWRSIRQGDGRGIFVDDSRWYEITQKGGKRHLLVRDGTEEDAPILFEGDVNTKEERQKVPEDIRLVLTANNYPWRNVRMRMTSGAYMYTESVRDDGQVQFRTGNHSGVHFHFQHLMEVIF